MIFQFFDCSRPFCFLLIEFHYCGVSQLLYSYDVSLR